jgi:nitroreductase
MQTREAIASRRSIRTFKPDPVPRELVEHLLLAGVQAPSAGNRQPWEFVVVQGERRHEMVAAMRQGLEKVRQSGRSLGSSEGSAHCMEQAPVTVFVFNPHQARGAAWEEWVVGNIADVQSAGAAIENMLLAAQDLGLGTLWICDVFLAYAELCDWLGRKDQLIAAVTIGYPDEAPGPRPRRTVAEVTTWLGG